MNAHEGKALPGESPQPVQREVAPNLENKPASGTTAPAADVKPASGTTAPAADVKPASGTTAPATDVTPATGGTNPPAKKPGTNRLGLTMVDYKGLESTLCNGCGHDAVSSHIVKAAFELGIQQHMVAKLSGIGCSSKSPAYFLGQAFGINTVHGRMPSVATGAALANKNLTLLAVSGDGDTASIGLGQFCHLIRRNVPLVYIIENNGVYGLTKGQFSATADNGAKSKSGSVNELPPIDLCGLAMELGATFVARSFSGDPKQMQPLIKAALSHRGTAIIDVLSPCVTFNEHEGSTKSREWGRKNELPIHSIGFVPHFEQISVEYEPGTVQEVHLHDGSVITLKKLDRDYDPTDRAAALKLLQDAREKKQFLTGLIYIDTKRESLPDALDLPDTALCQLSESELRPSKEALNEIMDALK